MRIKRSNNIKFELEQLSHLQCFCCDMQTSLCIICCLPACVTDKILLLLFFFAKGVKIICQGWVSKIRVLESSSNNMTGLAIYECSLAEKKKKRKRSSFLRSFSFQLTELVHRDHRENLSSLDTLSVLLP